MKKIALAVVGSIGLFMVAAPKAFAIQCAGLFPIITGNSCQTGQPVDLTQVLVDITNWITGLLGAVIVLVIIISGIQLAASAGNPDAIASAKKHIFNAVLSLILLISLRAILLLIGII